MIVYLHGFNSTPQSTKAPQLYDALTRRGQADQYCCPALPHRPSAAIAMIEALISETREQIALVGSSLGGYYASYLAEKYHLQAVLLNPATDPAALLHDYLGAQTNTYSGERYELTSEHLRELQALRVKQIDPRRYLLIVETGDEILDYRAALDRFDGAQHIVVEGGDHNLKSFPQHLPATFDFLQAAVRTS